MLIFIKGELTVWNALWAEVIRDGYHAKKDMDHTKPLVDKVTFHHCFILIYSY